MSGKILVLDPQISNKIAAGEVVEKPASVIKELVENSIDAGSENITIEIKNGGKDYIRISDDGSGIAPEDILVAFMRHATSKIATLNDIYSIKSLGFRGEALASISSVSNIEMISRTDAEEFGKKVLISGGKVLRNENVGAQRGTTIIVKDLFFNTPARLKFLKSNSAEQNVISSFVNKLAISHLNVSFKYIINDEIVFKTRGNGKLRDIVYDIFGKTVPSTMIDCLGETGETNLSGIISPLEFTRGNRQLQLTYVNGRYVNSSIINDSIALAYKGLLPINRFPVCFIFINVPADTVDVNIHPSKTEIKFHEEGKIKQLVYSSVRKAINEVNQVAHHTFEKSRIFTREIEDLPVVEAAPVIAPVPAEKSAIVAEPLAVPAEKPEAVSEAPLYEKPQRTYSYPRDSYPKDTEFVNLKYDFKDFFIKEELPQSEKAIESPEKLEKDESVYDDLKFVGQIFKSYLIFEKNDKMYLIDQHAAHEKILYEDFMKGYRKEKINSQILLEPIIIDLSYNDKNFILSKAEEINKSGFLMESFGSNSIIIREIPYVFDMSASKAFIEEYISAYSDSKSLTGFKEDSIIMESCKAAIKANMRINDIEINGIINGLKGLDDPYTCPHGRPIIIEVSKYEIERRFKRK